MSDLEIEERVGEEIELRDHADSTRADSPLTLDPTYTVVDTGRRSIDEVVAELEERVKADLAGPTRVDGR